MKSILVLGGSGFIGAHTVRRLCQDGGEAAIFLLNRGRSWAWDTRRDVLPEVRACIRWDRKRPLAECEALAAVLREVTVFDAVIDFSGYDSAAVGLSLDLLHDKCRLYIFISTDSVYEVCEGGQHPGPSRETDAILPANRARRKELKRRDSYGYKKLKCEELLRQRREECRSLGSEMVFDYVILRLADVIGPRDSTDRWWQCQLLLKAAHACCLPVFLPGKVKDVDISLVYVEDVAELISRLVTMDRDSLATVVNEAFNLCHTEVCSVGELFTQISLAMKPPQSRRHNAPPGDPGSDQNSLATLALTPTSHHNVFPPIDTNPHGSCPPMPSLIYTSRHNVPQMYPSVERGPVDPRKARSLLGWRPTPLTQAVAETVAFYETVHRDEGSFQAEKEDIYGSMEEDLQDLYSATDFAALQRQLRHILRLSE